MRLDRHKFLSWLKAKRPDEIIGDKQDCHSCPLANFYYETSGGCEAMIFDDPNKGYRIDRGYEVRQLPAWARRFVRGVDNSNGLKISAQRAAEILSGC